MTTKLLKPTKEQKELCKMTTGEFRVSYPHLFTPQAPPGSKKLKYSITMLFDKKLDMTGLDPLGNPRTLAQIIRQAKLNAFGPKENWPAGIVSPVTDGDDPKHADKGGYKGCWALTAKANEDARPSVVDRKMNAIIDPSVIYPGCYARAYINAYVHEYMGVIRVLLSLDHVQKIRDGQAFGGRKPVEQVFSPIVDAEEESPVDDSDDVDFR